MANGNDDIQMNINVPTDFSFQRKRPKLSRPERFKKKQQERAEELKSLLNKKRTNKRCEFEIVGDDGKVVKEDAKNIFTDKKVASENSAKSEKSSNKKSKVKKGDGLQRKQSDGLKRKHGSSEGQEPAYKKAKHSAIFANNPAIPNVISIPVQPVKEAVFSAKNFGDASLHPFMVSNLEKMGITTMTAVQQESLPVVLSGKDVLIKSQTGSGKTLSYAIPIIEKLHARKPAVKRSDGVFCIVVVPTRELAIQSSQCISSLLKPFIHIVSGSLMGGEKKKSEKARLRRGINILVGTPGRLVDHLKTTNCLSLDSVSYLVIDEADRLLDMGFARDVECIINELNEKSEQKIQTLLLSATLTAEVEKLAGMSLDNPVRLDISQKQPSKPSSKSLASTEIAADMFATPENLRHSFVIVPSKLRLVTLAAFLLSKCRESTVPCKIIVFLSTQDAVDFHYTLFNDSLNNKDDENDAIDLFRLHGDMEQKDRTKVFNDFHAVRGGVLLCTDVAARGLDLPHVEWIVQYNTPGDTRDYIHRVGRTARIGSTGNALLFLTPAEVKYLATMAEHNISMHEIEMNDILKSLLSLSKSQTLELEHKGNMPHSVEDSAAFLQAKFESMLVDSTDMRSMARAAFQSFVRAYATYRSSLKHIFHVRNLHLGHVATSFALSEPPSKVSELVGKYGEHLKTDDWAKGSKFKGARFGRFSKGTRFNPSGKEFRRSPGNQMRRKQKFSSMSEFDSGLDFLAKQAKGKKGKPRTSY